MTNTIDVIFNSTKFQFLTDEALFSSNQFDLGSRTLLESIILPEACKTIMDLGCGWGGMGIILAKLHPEKFVFLVDNDPVAIEVTKKNLELNGINNAKVFKADVTYSTVPQKFDLIVTNPPWTKNLSVTPSLVQFSYDHLNSSGTFLAVINKTFRLQDEMEKSFGNADLLLEKSSYKILKSTKLEEMRNDLLGGTVSTIKDYKIVLDPLKSQYFLTDSKLIENLLSAAQLKKSDIVLEIGPGLGAITEKLSEKVQKVVGIEIDYKFKSVLSKMPKNVNIIYDDFFNVFRSRNPELKFNKIVANLPFTSAGPTIFKLRNMKFGVAVLILPKRFATRLLETGSEKEFFEVEKLFDITRSFFYPMPEADSTAVILKRL